MKALKGIQERYPAAQAAREELEQRVGERTEELANSLSLVQATLEATMDGILVMDTEGKVTHFNKPFLTMWKIPADIAATRDNERLKEFVVSQLKEPERFLAQIEAIMTDVEGESFDVLEFMDGRFFERWSKPQRMGNKCVGRVWCFRDITERSRAEALLRRTEELYRHAIAGAGAVPYCYDYRTRSYLFMGEGIEELIGYPKEEVTREFWPRIMTESKMLGDTAGLSKDEAARRVAAGEIKSWRCDMRIITRSGQPRWIADASVQTVDEAGHPTGSMGILQDITERKQAELYALAFSNLGHDLVSCTTRSEAAHCMVKIADELLGWDSCSFYLYSEETNLVTRVLYIDTFEEGRRDVLLPGDVHTPLSPIDELVVKHGARLTLKKDTTRMEPGAIPYGNVSRPSASIMRVPVHVGTKVVALLNLHSYTTNAYTEKNLQVLQTLADYCGSALERISTETALRKSESQFRVVWNSSVDAMRLANSEGIIVQVNDAYCRLVKKTKQELEGKPLSIIFGSDEGGANLAAMKQTLASGGLTHFEKEVTLWDESKIWVEVSNSMVELPDQRPLVLGIVRDISARKQAEANLKKAHEELLTTSRMAGMAEVATSVLHNVGNVLNSVNISSTRVSEKIRNSKAAGLEKVVALLKSHVGDLPGFFSNDPKARGLTDYLEKLSAHLGDEQALLQDELASLCSNIEHIKEIVSMQQSYAKIAGVREDVSLTALVEDALRMNAGALDRHLVRVIREFGDVPPVCVEKHKVLQILVNVIRNAKYAVDTNEDREKQIRVRVERNGAMAVISVIDNGIGIPPENLTRIFSHGFTTKKEGHGFGLHSGALAAKELGGTLRVQSEGSEKGATFTLEIPLGEAAQIL